MSDINLKPFCGTDELRDYLMAPFSRDEWTYATNGQIAVRVPRRPCVTENSRAPNAGSVFKGNAVMTFSPLKIELPPLLLTECSTCDGMGGGYHVCPNCDCPCEKCEGTGKSSSDHGEFELIGDIWFARKYLRLLLTLPNPYVPNSPRPKEGMPFRFDGGEGVLMPVNR